MREFLLTDLGLNAISAREFQEISVNSDDIQKTSLFGTPIWSNLLLPAASYRALDGTIIELSEVEIDTALFTVSQGKNIVTTDIQGRNGTVKEYISDGDYSVNIYGAIIGENENTYPEALVLDFLEHLQAPVSLKIESEFLSLFDIDEIVFTSFDFPQRRGSRDFQAFSASALSDRPLELKNSNGI